MRRNGPTEGEGKGQMSPGLRGPLPFDLAQPINLRYPDSSFDWSHHLTYEHLFGLLDWAHNPLGQEIQRSCGITRVVAGFVSEQAMSAHAAGLARRTLRRDMLRRDDGPPQSAFSISDTYVADTYILLSRPH